MNNVVTQIKSECEGEIANQMSIALNEPIDRIKLAIEGSATGVFLAYLKRATSESGLYLLFNIVNDKENPFSKIHHEKISVDKWIRLADEGNSLMSKIIPDKKSPLITFLSSHAGVKNISSNKINGFTNLLILNKLRDAIGDTQNDLGPLAEFFNVNKDDLTENGPQKMITKLVQILGLGNYLNINKNVLTPTPIKNSKAEVEKTKKTEAAKIRKEENNYQTETTGGKNWLIPAIFVGVLALGILAYFVNQNKEQLFGKSDTLKDTLTTIATKTDTLTNILQDSLTITKQDSINLADSLSKITANSQVLDIKLPDGQKISLNEGDIDQQVFTFVNDSSNTSNKANFTTKSQQFNISNNFPKTENITWLNNLASIMKAFPSSRLKIQVNNYIVDSDSTFNNKSNANKMAYNLKRIFLNKGINDIRIDPVGKTINTKPTKDQLNKQVEITYFKK